MKPLLYAFFIAISLPSWGEEDVCHYAGAFEAVRLNVDYDLIFGASDLCLQTIFQSEGGEELSVFDERARLHACMDVGDSQLGQFVPISHDELYPFERGSDRIKISVLVDEKDFGFPRLWRYPMAQSSLIHPDSLEWKPSGMDEYDESSVIVVSNDNVELKLTLHRWCY